MSIKPTGDGAGGNNVDYAVTACSFA
jgi:hypothetical protein